jgi:hypothetical protein
MVKHRRIGNVAMYHSYVDSRPLGIEVFEVYVSEVRSMRKCYELYPDKEDFGESAFKYLTKDYAKATQKFIELKEKETQRNKNDKSKI